MGFVPSDDFPESMKNTMDSKAFQAMWERMQVEGYFSEHAHYRFDHGQAPGAEEQALDARLRELDYSGEAVVFPVPYSEMLERSVKRLEPWWLPRMFDLPQDGAALDIGCGYGRSVNWLRRVYQRVVGVDISAAAIDRALHNLDGAGNVELLTCSGDKLPAALADASFEVAYAFTVFQHIPREYTASLLKDAHRVLKPGGKIAFNLLSGINEQANEGDLDTEWAIGYSEQAASELLSSTGYALEKQVHWSGPGSDVAWLWLLARAV